jgi:acylphosphatase
MSRRPARCTEADLKRVIKAVLALGAHGTVEILPDGTIRVETTAIKPANVNAPKRRIAL